jgi:hypothetical protein
MTEQWKRRPIESRTEKDQVRGEQQDKIVKIKAEQKDQKEGGAREHDLVNAPTRPPDPDHSLDNWSPPRHLADFTALVESAHPGWPRERQLWEATTMFERYPLIEAAFLGGLAVGRSLRERARYDLGWWWDELAPLKPAERGLVLDRVRAIVMKGVVRN